MSTTIADALLEGRRQLSSIQIVTAALDSRLLMQAAIGVSHEVLVAESDALLTEEQQLQFAALIARRMTHEPVSKILGRKEFYGREFKVSSDVLDPRPDTEALIELALRCVSRKVPVRILDLGSGSGAIICTLLAELPRATGVAVDLSTAALDQTNHNAKHLGVADRLDIVAGAWFEQVTGQFDLVVSNPPYIPHGDIAGLVPDVRDFDPHLALNGGPDGLSCYRSIAEGVSGYLTAGGHVIVELGAGQLPEVRAIFESFSLIYLDQCDDLSRQVRAVAFACSFP